MGDRLRILAKKQGEQLQNVLNRYGLERWLYRLCQSPHRERFVLKGAMLFTLWSEEPHRRTRDLDLLGFGASSIPEWEQIFREICRIKVEPDGLDMLPDTVRGETIRVEEEYAGVRIKLMAMLGKARIPMQIDVGFGDAVTPPPQEIAFPTMLDFPAPSLRAYRPETVIAEKFHAMVDHGLRNTRMKDYYDIWKLSRQFEFDGEVLVEAILATFGRRQTILPSNAPVGLTARFSLDPLKISQWTAFLRKSGLKEQEMNRAFAGKLSAPARAGRANWRTISSSLDARWLLGSRGANSYRRRRETMNEVHVSTDVETDGPIPGINSMPQMDLHADLAVLSACETACGRMGAGEGLTGLTWALFVAGVPTTVVSLWKVESVATHDWMFAIHRQLRAPTARTTKAAALRQAALSVLKNPATSHRFIGRASCWWARGGAHGAMVSV